MTEYLPSEKGTPIRFPSSALLAVDSSDRKIDASGLFIEPVWDFLITRNNSILNGFFTRIGLTELSLKWDTPNISSALGNNTLSLEVSGGYVVNMTLPNQFACEAACIFDGIVKYVNDLSGVSGFYLQMVPGLPSSNPLRPCTYQLQGFDVATNNPLAFKFYKTNLARQLNLWTPSADETNNNYVLYYEPTFPDLRPYAYIDFVSNNLTYNQDLKDTSTNTNNVDILQRFYFSWQEQNTYDKYNYPILMGYCPFVVKQLWNPPKQIKWSPNQPIGQIAFQVYGEPLPAAPTQANKYGLITLPSYSTEYLFTLQVSEF